MTCKIMGKSSKSRKHYTQHDIVTGMFDHVKHEIDLSVKLSENLAVHDGNIIFASVICFYRDSLPYLGLAHCLEVIDEVSIPSTNKAEKIVILEKIYCDLKENNNYDEFNLDKYLDK